MSASYAQSSTCGVFDYIGSEHRPMPMDTHAHGQSWAKLLKSEPELSKSLTPP